MQGLSSVAGSYDIVILTNGPGEVAAWVKPVVKALRRGFGEDREKLRISVVLSPCPHASQQEAALVRSFPEVDRCQEARHFTSLLVWGQTAEGWDWRKNGVSLFLGGDQFNALVLGWRLGYKTVLYAEEAVRWAWLADAYFLRNASLLTGVPSFAQKRCEIVGDLFVDAVSEDRKASFGETVAAANLNTPKQSFNTSRERQADVERSSAGSNESTNGAANLDLETAVPGTRDFSTEDADRIRSHSEAGTREQLKGHFTVGILPGSKPAKLGLGVPYFLAAVDRIRAESPDVRFVLPLAPTVSLEELAAQACPDRNPNIHQFGWTSANLALLASSHSSRFTPDPSGAPVAILTTPGGARVEVYHHFPAYDVFRECDVCLTTIGTNTAELGSLAVPMIVVLPTHSLEVFRGATGGIGGLLANLPGPVGDVAARVVNGALLKSAGFIAWPNRWAKEAVVPELVGRIEPNEVAAVVLDHMRNPAKLQSMKERLRSLNQGLAGEAASGEGAAERIAQHIKDLLEPRGQKPLLNG
ncbi:lipid-A-disaccharide synthase [Klebsormidium nitens]|uniref:Lipid-A-disaccharide synthase n=1 Tax=Klebsormidium nitens TaxID=105231 RepID=A0A1Y1HK21_KLENI|nr:lipid-A-disaccharide synthase [Klebsormidium nitens]|eukprot:GAQ78904.1 lipid-A-disaccharide synthase [Klebsormidium nitens]